MQRALCNARICLNRAVNTSFIANAILAISILKILRADLEFAGNQTSERWRNVAELGQIDENVFFGLPFDQSSLLTSERRIERALAVPDQLSVWTNWLVARQECIENGLSGIIKAFANEELEANRLSQALSLKARII